MVTGLSELCAGALCGDDALLREHRSVGIRNDQVLDMVVPSLFSFVVAIGFVVQSWPLVLGGALAAGASGWYFSRRRRHRELDGAVARAKVTEEAARLAQAPGTEPGVEPAP